MLRQQVLRSSRAAIVRPVQTRKAHAISNPTLANIEKRWESMPPQEQADLWMALRDRMKVNWAELTLQEKKAGRPPILIEPFHLQTRISTLSLPSPISHHRIARRMRGCKAGLVMIAKRGGRESLLLRTIADLIPHSILHRLRRPRPPRPASPRRGLESGCVHSNRCWCFVRYLRDYSIFR